MDPPKRRVKVIIIGAAVSGLTLAHMLERAGIDFVILERGKEVAFAGGASIGLQPNALRILDQLGLYEDICAATVPIKTAYHRRPNGSVIAGSQFAGELERRHGYPIMFLEREELLHILERKLENRSKILCLQHVVNIQHDRNRAVVTTASGDAFEGDIVVGADGVRSFTRQTMWKNLAITEPKVSQKESSGDIALTKSSSTFQIH
jgi:FAD dependent monooxygenase